jgi:putative chitinase
MTVVTYADLLGMFPGKLRTAHKADVEKGLPSLNAEMAKAGITTPRRIAAFLTTLVFESWVEYNVHQVGTTTKYTGRGYIQLTGMSNYSDAGKYLGVDLVTSPDLAMSLAWSAKIATWYWTKARPKCNEYADTLQMGKINGAIGYPRSADGSNDNARCTAFAAALRYLTGSTPSGISCVR